MDINLLFKKIPALLYRFNEVIFVIVIFGGVALGVFYIGQIVRDPTQGKEYTPDQVKVLFNTQVMDKINELTPSSEVNAIKKPEGRISPFTE